MYKVYKDQPIKNATHFNFNAYSNALASIILNKENKTPFTIAINGKWGSGKTTLMKTLRTELDSSNPNEINRKVRTVWFDAWKYTECDSMLAALVSEILEEMQRQSVLDNLRTKILVGAEKFDLFKGLSDLAKILTQGNGPEFEKWFRNTQYQNKLSFFDLFQDYMKTILQTFVLKGEDGEYADSKGVLVIFIDDLDRCPPKNVANVLESINLFLDLEGCFFVIGTDMSIISNAIDYEYQGIKDFSGIDYIKKMIQLNFDLPLLKEHDIQSFMKTELKIDSKLDPYFDIIVKGLKSNQREIIRFLNSLNLMRILGESLQGTGYEEELLIKWSVLNFSSVNFIEEVKRKPVLLIATQEISREGLSEALSICDRLKVPHLEDKCRQFSANDKISAVLSQGTKSFTLESIETYLFLSKIAPKEAQIDPVHVTDDFEIPKNFRYEDLREMKFERSNLVEADFTGANLREVNMKLSNLRKASLTEADLTGANLEKAKLIGADLRGANLRRANLTGADLRRAALTGAKIIGARLNGANLIDAELSDIKFKESDLSFANFEGASLYDTSFEGANLDEANFSRINCNDYTLESIIHSSIWKTATFDYITGEKLSSLSKEKQKSNEI